jgi:NDP-sugar pyrophosphorylase family protein
MDYAIIAAGEGSRLAQEGVKCAKPLVRLNGVTLVDRLIDVFVRNQATSVSIIVNEEMKEVQEYLKGIRPGVPFRVIVKSTPSSMHSFYEISRHINSERICLTTVDTVFREEEFREYIRAFLAEKDLDGLMAVTGYIDDEKPLYVKTDPSLRIEDFLDACPPLCRFVSGGIYCLKRTCLGALDRVVASGMSHMRNYQRQLIAEGLRLRAYPFGKIIDVDHAGDIGKAEAFLLS